MITPKKLFCIPGTSLKKPITFPFSFQILKDLPSTPILPEVSRISWKNQLTVSLPHETVHKNLWGQYLKGLKDGDVLLTTSRLQVNTQNAFNKVTFSITYGDIKGYTLDTPYDLLEAIFQEEYLKFILSMGAVWGESFL